MKTREPKLSEHEARAKFALQDDGWTVFRGQTTDFFCARVRDSTLELKFVEVKQTGERLSDRQVADKEQCTVLGIAYEVMFGDQLPNEYDALVEELPDPEALERVKSHIKMVRGRGAVKFSEVMWATGASHTQIRRALDEIRRASP